jgi:hypothetical protein
VPHGHTGEHEGRGWAAASWPRRSSAWLRDHVRGVAGCAVVFGVGIAFGFAFGSGGSGSDPKSTTVVNVGGNVTVGVGGSSSSP